MKDRPRGYYVVYKRTPPILYCSQVVLKDFLFVNPDKAKNKVQ